MNIEEFCSLEQNKFKPVCRRYFVTTLDKTNVDTVRMHNFLAGHDDEFIKPYIDGSGSGSDNSGDSGGSGSGGSGDSGNSGSSGSSGSGSGNSGSSGSGSGNSGGGSSGSGSGNSGSSGSGSGNSGGGSSGSGGGSSGSGGGSSGSGNSGSGGGSSGGGSSGGGNSGSGSGSSGSGSGSGSGSSGSGGSSGNSGSGGSRSGRELQYLIERGYETRILQTNIAELYDKLVGEGVDQSYITKALGNTSVVTVEGEQAVMFESLEAGYIALAALQGVQRGYDAGVAAWERDQAAKKAAEEAAAEEAEEATEEEKAAKEAAAEAAEKAAEERKAAEEAAAEAAEKAAEQEQAAEEAAVQEELEEASRLRVLQQSKFEQVGEVVDSFDEANGVKLELTMAEKWALVIDDSLKTDAEILDKIEKFYQWKTSEIAKPFDAAKLKMDSLFGDADDAYGVLQTKIAEYNTTDEALTKLLVSNPISTEIATLQETLQTQADAVRTASGTFADASHLLDGANAGFEAAQSEYNLASSALDSTFVDSDVATKLVANGGELAMQASELLTESTTFFDSFPSLLKAKKTTYFNALRDDVNKTDLDIQAMKDKLPGLKDDLAAKGSDVRATLQLSETTADEQLAKLTAVSEARTAYHTALNALRGEITTVNEAITARNNGANFKLLLENRPSTTSVLDDVAPFTEDDMEEFNTAYSALETLHVSTVDENLAALSDLADVSGTDLQESASLLESTTARYRALKAAEPAAGLPKTDWQLRMTNIEARLRNLGADISSKVQDFDTKFETYTSAAEKAKVQFMTKLGYTSTETTNLLSSSAPTIEMASVDATVDSSLGALPTVAASTFLRQRQLAAAGTVSRALSQTSNLGLAISRYTGATRLAQTIYSLVQPAGRFALPLAEMPLASSSFLASRGLSTSPLLNQAARTALPFLRVLGASARFLGVIGTPILIGLSVAEIVMSVQASNANQYVGGDYGMKITSSTRDNMIMKSPNDSLDDHGHDQYYDKTGSDHYVPSTSYLSWFNYYLNETNTFQESFEAGLDADHAYFTKFASYTMHYKTPTNVLPSVTYERYPTYQPDFLSTTETNAWRVFCMVYDSMNTDIKALVAQGLSKSDAITQVVQNTQQYVSAAETNDRPLYITRTTGQEGYTYAMLSGFNSKDTANVLAMIKNGDSLDGFTAETLTLMGLPPEALDTNFVNTQQFTDLCNANPNYQAALNNYQTSQLQMISKATVNSYETLLSQIDPSETDTIRYLQYQLQLLRTANKSTLPADMQAQTTNITPEEATTYFDDIYNSPSYLSFQAAWQAGTAVQTSLDDFTESTGRPAKIMSWFSVGANSVYSSYATAIPDQIKNEALENSVNLVQQLGVFDFTKDVLGALGNGIFNSTHTFESRQFDDMQTIALELASWVEDTNATTIASKFGNYRLVSDDGVSLNNMFSTYRDQLIREGVADPDIGAYNVLLNKIVLANSVPEKPFFIMDEKDATGNSVRTVGNVVANKHEIAHVQALYNKDNTIFDGTPVAVLRALGYNTALSNGALPAGETVASSESYAAPVSASLVQEYDTMIDARDTIEQLNATTNAATAASTGATDAP